MPVLWKKNFLVIIFLLIISGVVISCGGAKAVRDVAAGADRDLSSGWNREGKFENSSAKRVRFKILKKSRGQKKAASKPKKKKRHHSGNKVLKVFNGRASYYGRRFHGRKTASGEIYNQYQLTAAHRSLPFGTICRVTNKGNGRSVVVRINDRGPFVRGRNIDLSYRAAQKLKAVKSGVIRVKIEILEYGKK